MSTNTITQPVVFLPHGGGPLPLLDDPNDEWTRMNKFIKSIPSKLPSKPKTLLIVSAHWEEKTTSITNSENPGLLFDYGGFPKHTYEYEWPAKGNPELAKRLHDALKAKGVESKLDDKRPLDHGVFIPMLLMYPDADIPTIQLSLQKNLDPKLHLKIGEILSEFRDEGVLIIGSGYTFHNMQIFKSPGIHGLKFDEWLTETMQADKKTRDERLAEWSNAPEARYAHPREEHLLPLHVIAGAARDGEQVETFSDTQMNARNSGFVIGGVKLDQAEEETDDKKE
mmetsp:Transcript_15123/g.25993  ORF Transcript_15123/g.25993 Transcript_15123/m.25993 type:complete len:282 (+) Transcript_15123:123-968(+)